MLYGEVKNSLLAYFIIRIGKLVKHNYLIFVLFVLTSCTSYVGTKSSTNYKIEPEEYKQIKATIRRVIIAGNKYTNEKVIRREVELFPGQAYSYSFALKSLKKVYNLHYFENVKIKIIKNSDDSIDCIIIVKEKIPIS